MDIIENLTEFEQAIAANWPGDEIISPGICPTCPNCQYDHNMSPRAFYSAYQKDEIPDESSYSNARCDCCGLYLSGDRYVAHHVTADSKVSHLEICGDCLCYLANGDIPEIWEG